ncbi:MAG TPA: hypothetical protein IGS53_20000 [Leptolyngbyaceae cyanobacterium M33_DOE_097]|nr:hypothetical protein [Leptolyngbyaceae cyanobacterium M33_DOE_097]
MLRPLRMMPPQVGLLMNAIASTTFPVQAEELLPVSHNDVASQTSSPHNLESPHR